MLFTRALVLFISLLIANVVPSLAQRQLFTLSTPSAEYGDDNFFNGDKEIKFTVTENANTRFGMFYYDFSLSTLTLVRNGGGFFEDRLH